jgi:pyrroloquinoline quinone biosynthesis protein D
MIGKAARPRLAKKAMLRVDKKTGQKVLLYPEKGLVLNATGAAILELCDGQRSFDAIVSALARTFDAGPAAGLEQETEAFLTTLAERGLVEGLGDD